MALELPFLDDRNPVFPDPTSAMVEPDGLLAAGGNLDPATLLNAYRQGIFPWYEEGQPILWWCPAERAVLQPGDLYIARSLRKFLRNTSFRITSDQAFSKVISCCALPRGDHSGTWITPEMAEAYCRLRSEGHAHSIEVWRGEQLVGGLYGLAIGSIFCGESMFSLEANASKVALVALVSSLFNSGFSLIDCQIPNSHLIRLGVKVIQRDEFLELLHTLKNCPQYWPSDFKHDWLSPENKTKVSP